MTQNPPSEYVPNPQAAHPPVPPQPLPPQPQGQFLPPQPGAPAPEAPYRSYVPATRKRNWTFAIIGIVALVLAIPALFLFIGVFSWAIGIR